MGGRSRQSGVASWRIAVLAVLVVAELVGGLGTVLLHQGRTGTVAGDRSLSSRARPVPVDPALAGHRARVVAVRRLLDARAEAVLARNRTEFMATVDSAEPGFLDAQAELFDNLAAVPLASWRYALDPSIVQDTSGSALARYQAPVWAPSVTLQYELAGFDQEPTAEPQYLTFVQRPAGWRVASDSDFAAAGLHTARGLWDDGPVQVVRGERSLVLGHPGSHALLAQLAGEIDQAVLRVDAVWGTDWSQRAVVLVPDSQAELGRLIEENGDLSQIAAVATAELTGVTERRVPVGDRILINPPNFALLGPLGRRVVLTHEVTHVATRSVTGPDEPTWLVEGIADYVGYLGTGVPVASAARELRDDIRAGALPSALPGDGAFTGSNPALPQTYEAAWLAVRLIVAQSDQATLLAFYRAIGAAPAYQAHQAVQDAFATVLHTTTESFTAAWRAALRAQLS